jgi:hypothetical protein
MVEIPNKLMVDFRRVLGRSFYCPIIWQNGVDIVSEALFQVRSSLKDTSLNEFSNFFSLFIKTGGLFTDKKMYYFYKTNNKLFQLSWELRDKVPNLYWKSIRIWDLGMVVENKLKDTIFYERIKTSNK